MKLSIPQSPKWLIIISIITRLIFFIYGIYQDNHFKIKYTDIDYQVFNDASFFVYHHKSPFLRDTYRYTPLLSWIILPNHWTQWYHSSKLTFIVSDIITGSMIIQLLHNWIDIKQAQLITAAIWLLNPLVITISTRGNCETVLCLMIIAVFYTIHYNHYTIAAIVYGLSIHFKIYPIIYCGPIAIYLFKVGTGFKSVVKFGIVALLTLVTSTYWMFAIYGDSYMNEAWWYHIIRIDHRHNFSIWNVLLYYTSTFPNSNLSLATFAFVPQLLITVIMSGVWLPWKVLNDKGTATNQHLLTLLNIVFIQTFTFVTFNKVCTSQYFIWYIILLPFVVTRSRLNQDSNLNCKKAIGMIVLWVVTQGLWLQQGYNLEFLGLNVFYPGLLLASASFFIANVYIIGQFIQDLVITA